MPPDDIIDGDLTDSTDSLEDTDTEDTEIEDTDTEEQGTDTGDENPESSCFDAMLCIAMTPEDTPDCISGLEREDAEAARELAFCVLAECPEAVDDLLAFGFCLMSPCADASLNCVGSSFF